MGYMKNTDASNKMIQTNVNKADASYANTQEDNVNAQDSRSQTISSEELADREVYKFRLVTRLGETMLKNGGEIFRADEAMRYAADAFGLKDFCSYVIANGMFSSFCSGNQMYSCKILSLPLTPIVLNKVEALNALSRKISSEGCSPEEVENALNEIDCMESVANWKKVLAAAAGAACFSCLFRGSITDGAGAFIAGLVLFLLYPCAKLHLPKIMTNIAGAAVAALMCCLLYGLGIGNNLDLMMIGPVFVMAPGVLLTNAIRNFMENDYLSGLLRLMDAVLVAGAIAIGVGSVMRIWFMLTGGAI